MNKLIHPLIFTLLLFSFSFLGFAIFFFPEQGKVLGESAVLAVNDGIAPSFEFISPPTEVSGEVIISAVSSIPLSDVKFKVAGGSAEIFSATSEENNHSFVWDTTFFSNGSYYVKVYSESFGYENHYSISVVVVNDSSTSPENPTFSFISPPANVSGAIIIQAQSDMELYDLKFQVSGEIEEFFPASTEDGFTHFFVWETQNYFPNGIYTIKVYSSTYGNTHYSLISTIVENEEAGNNTPPIPEFSFISMPNSVTDKVEISANSSMELYDINFHLSGPIEKFIQAKTANGLTHSFVLDPEYFPKGAYLVKVYSISYGLDHFDLATIIVEEKANIKDDQLEFSFLPYPSYISVSDIITVSAESSLEINDAVFRIIGLKDQEFNTQNESGTAHSFIWDTTDFPAGNYGIKIYSPSYGSDIYESVYITLKDDSASNSSENYPVFQFINTEQVISGNTKIQAKSSVELSDVRFRVDGPMDKIFYSGTSDGFTHWFSLDSGSFFDGEYNIKVYSQFYGENYSDLFQVRVENLAPEQEIFLDPMPKKVSGTLHLVAKTKIEAPEVTFEIIGAKEEKFSANSSDNKIHKIDWNTANFPDGEYLVKAYFTDQAVYQDSKKVYVSNAVNLANEELRVSFVSKPNKISGDFYLSAKTSGEVDKLDFIFSGPANYTFAGKNNSQNEYGFLWNTIKYPDGHYKVAALARKGDIFVEDFIFIDVFNKEEQKYELDKEDDHIVILSHTGQNMPVSGSVELIAKVSNPIIEINFVAGNKKGESINLGKGREGYHENEWRLIWDTNKFYDEVYSIAAIAKFQDNKKVESGKIDFTVKNNYPVGASVIEHNENKLASEEFKREKMRLEELKILRQSGVIDDLILKEKTEFVRKKFVHKLPWECENRGIKKADDCDRFLFRLHLPDVCREAEVGTLEECDKIIMLHKLPLECRKKGITNMKQCDEYLFEFYKKPNECENLEFEECREIIKNIFSNNLLFTPLENLKNIRVDKMPSDCIEAGIKDFYECSEFMEQKYLPEECKDEKILNKNDCVSYMDSYYGKPDECLGIEDDECAQIVQKIAPLEARYIVAKKEIPYECLNAGVKSFSECEIIMREQYMPIKCKELGIKTKESCKEKMIELYGEPEECKEFTGVECQNFIDSVILSDFIDEDELKKAKQEMQKVSGAHLKIKKADQKLDVKIVGKQGEKTADKELENIVEKFIPFTKKQDEHAINLMVIKAKEVSADKEITASFVISIDSDSDGLHDDMEKRLGTDPEKFDSDSDGFSDGEEVANNYNPLGRGKIKEEIKPIERAIAMGKSLEQPKTSIVPESSSLKVESVEILPFDEKESGKHIVKIDGQAAPDSFVSLFIYSGMPIIMTVSADKNGNWTYELDKTLIDGKHETYVVIHDEDGNIKSQSAPFSFFVKEALAVTRNDFIRSLEVPADSNEDETKLLIYFYVIGGVMFIFGGVGLYVVNGKIRKKENNVI